MSNFEPAGGRHEGPSVPLAGPPDVAGPSSLRGYAGTLRRRWRWIALGALVGLLAGGLAAVLQKDVRDPTRYYRATTTLIANGAAGAAGDGVDAPAPDTGQVAFLIGSADVVNGVAAELDVSPTEVTDKVTAVAQGDVQAIDVIAISTDPDQAVDLADTAAQVLVDYVSTDQQRLYAAQRSEILDELTRLDQQRTDLEAQLAAAPPDPGPILSELAGLAADVQAANEALQALPAEGAPLGGFAVLSPATPVEINGTAYQLRLQANREGRGSSAFESTSGAGTLAGETDLGRSAPVSRSVRLLVGLASGLVLGLVTAFVVEAWDDRLRRSERTEGVTGFPVIAEVPLLPKAERDATVVAAVDSPGSRVSERYRAIRTSLLFLLHQTATSGPTGGGGGSRRTPVVLVTSPNPSEGKTTSVANIAAAFGDNGARTLVIDGDYRKPAVARYLQPRPAVGRLDEPAPTRLDGVWFVPAPRTGSRVGEIVQSILAVVERWRDDFDVVLLDTPPMLTTNDAVDLLPAADSLLLVVRAGQTRVGQAERAANLLRRFDVDVLGVVLNGCSDRDTDDAYGYGYDYDFVPAAEPSDAPGGATPDGKAASEPEAARADGSDRPHGEDPVVGAGPTDEPAAPTTTGPTTDGPATAATAGAVEPVAAPREADDGPPAPSDGERPTQPSALLARLLGIEPDTGRSDDGADPGSDTDEAVPSDAERTTGTGGAVAPEA